MAVTTSVAGATKTILHGGKGSPIEFVKNTKAIIHFRAIRLASGDQLEDVVIDDTRSTLHNGPFELLFGREFKLSVWEEWVKGMLLNEIALFTCPFKLVTDYPTLSQALRKMSKMNTGEELDHREQHQCGYSRMMHGSPNPDLDELMANRPMMAFEFELLQVNAPGSYKQEAWAMSDSEKLDLIPKLKEEGNTLYRSGDHVLAAGKYFEAISYLEQLIVKEKPQSDIWDELEQKKVPLLLNYCQCKLLMKEYLVVLKHTTQVLEFEPDNVKALFRRGKAYSASWCEEEAKQDFARVVELDPTLKKTVDKELKELNERIQEKTKEEREKLQGKLF